MKYKLLGHTGLRVSALGLGTMTFLRDGRWGSIAEGVSWGSSKEESRRICDAFVDAGGNFIDSSNSYGASEEWLGEFLADRRQRVVLTTKYNGNNTGDDPNSAGSHRKSLVHSLEQSLRLLRTDYIDLLWVHAWDFMTPADEVMRALDDVIRQGKVLYVGASNTPAWMVAHANTLASQRGWTPFAALQLEYNLLERDVEREFLPMARTLDIGVAAWTPLASGWLTGKYVDGDSASDGPRRLDDPQMARFVSQTDANRAVLDLVREIAAEVGCEVAHVALNWLIQRGIVPIFGARTEAQVKDNLACLGSELSTEQLERLDRIGKIRLGYPHAFLASPIVRKFIYGRQPVEDHRARRL